MSILTVEHLSFKYLQATSNTLNDISFEAEPGTVTAIVGANGSGKSTLCYALAGFIPYFFKGEMQGNVRVNGTDTQKTQLAELVTDVGMVFQNPFNQISGAKLTVSEEIAFGLENLGIPRDEMQVRITRALELFGLQQVAQQSPYALSGGQQQRLALASIFVMEPPVMVLDEPTSQLDPDGTRQVMERIQALVSQGRTIILVEHKLEWVARLASRAFVLDKGKLVADGAPRTVLSHAFEWGLRETRYSSAARLAQTRALIGKDIELPQTLEQARALFQGQPTS